MTHENNKHDSQEQVTAVATERVIAVEEHIATESFLRVAHGLEPLPGDHTELELTRAYENAYPVRSDLLDLDARIASMDAVGQDMAILSLNPPGVQPYLLADATPLARDFNDSLAAIVRRRPDRFGGLGAVAPQDPSGAATEIERIMGPLGLHGIMINSHTDGHYLDEPQFAPLLDAAEGHRAPIYLHPRMPAILAPYNNYGMQAAIWGYQAEAGLHVIRLILSGTLDRHPDLTIVLGHLGEGIPYWLKRIDNRHVFAQRIAGAAGDMPKLKLTPSEYFRRNFVITTSGIDDPNVLALALQTVGSAHIMFAIDTPYEDPKDARAFITNAPITPCQRADINYHTAEWAFGYR